MVDPTGGPAFPWLDPDKASGLPAQSPGMSLRAWFAGQAMAALVSDPGNLNAMSAMAKAGSGRERDIAAGMAVQLADALIAKLAEGGES